MKDVAIEESLVKTLKESDFSKLSNDISGVILDEIAKSIPVIGTIQSLSKIHLNIKDFIFAKKLLKFLASFSDISSEKRIKLIKKLEDDDNFQQKVGEYIIIILDRLDDLQKPVLVAKAFRAYLENKIDGIQLQRINYGIDKVLMCNLQELKRYYSIDSPRNLSHDILEPMVFQNFASCGFINLTTGWCSSVGAAKNELGELFVKTILC